MKQIRDKRRRTLLIGIAWLGLVTMTPLSAEQSATLKGGGVVWDVVFSLDGKRIASGSEDRTIRVWDAQTGKEQLSLKGHTDIVRSVCFSPDGKRIASASYDNIVKVWDAHTGQETITFTGHTDLVSSVCFSPDS